MARVPTEAETVANKTGLLRSTKSQAVLRIAQKLYELVDRQDGGFEPVEVMFLVYEKREENRLRVKWGATGSLKEKFLNGERLVAAELMVGSSQRDYFKRHDTQAAMAKETTIIAPTEEARQMFSFLPQSVRSVEEDSGLSSTYTSPYTSPSASPSVTPRKRRRVASDDEEDDDDVMQVAAPTKTTPAPAAPTKTTPAPAAPTKTTPAPGAPLAKKAKTTPAPAAPLAKKAKTTQAPAAPLAKKAKTTPAPAAPLAKKAKTTPAPAAPKKTTPAPAVPKKTTPAPAAPKKTTPAPAAPKKTTPAPAVPKKTTPAPAVPKKTTPAPAVPSAKKAKMAPALPAAPPVECLQPLELVTMEMAAEESPFRPGNYVLVDVPRNDGTTEEFVAHVRDTYDGACSLTYLHRHQQDATLWRYPDVPDVETLDNRDIGIVLAPGEFTIFKRTDCYRFPELL